ncbi:MAG: hypothetical protein METHAR1v1_1800015 [Methanothrix sp.]|nr:MAG: hypothetical protein METHAR1v1_1800015 [Methanothrix sp.]
MEPGHKDGGRGKKEEEEEPKEA